MVAEKVKSALLIGFQKPPVSSEKVSTAAFTRHSPRATSNATELLRLVEELRERESKLKTELKLVKEESVAIVPFLEIEISNKDSEIQRYKKKIDCLETENDRLRGENELLHEELSEQNRKYDEKIKRMQVELIEIKRIVEDDVSSSSSSSSTNSKCIDVRNCKSSVAAKFLRRITETELKNDEFVGVVESIEKSEIQQTSDGLMINFQTMWDDSRQTTTKSCAPRVPKPPPRPSSFSSSSFSLPSYDSKAVVPPPPPPPPPPKGLKPVVAKVRRVPEVVEFYQSLMRRDSNWQRERGGGSGCATDAGATTKDMIGEIENRSTHLLAIKTDVETQGDFIKFLIKEVESAAFTDIEDVVPFVKWLDDELSYLVDERAVLKHFEWPEQKADALREAAFGYGDLKKLESEASSFHDDPRQPCGLALKKMQALFEKLEHGVYNLSRMRESAMRRYKVFQIPVSWMMDTGYVSQIKLACVKLAMKYMKRVLVELEMVWGGPEEEQLIVRGVKFAFRVHQFARGFDVDTMRAFQELRDKAQLCYVGYKQ